MTSSHSLLRLGWQIRTGSHFSLYCCVLLPKWKEANMLGTEFPKHKILLTVCNISGELESRTFWLVGFIYTVFHINTHLVRPGNRLFLTHLTSTHQHHNKHMGRRTISPGKRQLNPVGQIKILQIEYGKFFCRLTTARDWNPSVRQHQIPLMP